MLAGEYLIVGQLNAETQAHETAKRTSFNEDLMANASSVQCASGDVFTLE